MNAFKRASYIGIVLIIISCILFIYGFYNLKIEKKLDKEGIKTIGVVYELEPIEPYKRAWVKFLDQNGDTIRFLDKLYWNKSFEKYTIGQQVEVIYIPSSPAQSATINDFFQRNTTVYWPIVLGGIIAIIGIIIRYRMLKKSKKFEKQMNKYQ